MPTTDFLISRSKSRMALTDLLVTFEHYNVMLLENFDSGLLSVERSVVQPMNIGMWRGQYVYWKVTRKNNASVDVTKQTGHHTYTNGCGEILK
jgi:hypothetical protein